MVDHRLAFVWGVADTTVMGERDPTPPADLFKPFFVGRSQCVEDYQNVTRSVVRFETEAGARRVQHGATMQDRNGTILGRVTSCVSLGEMQVGLALIDRLTFEPGDAISILNPPQGRAAENSLAELETGDRLPPIVRGVVLPRLRDRDESRQSEAG